MNRTLYDNGCSSSKPLSLVLLVALFLAGCLLSGDLFAASTITYVQSNSATPQSSQTSVTVTFTAAQRAVRGSQRCRRGGVEQ